MGIMSRQQGQDYVITSDCNPSDASVKRAPRKVSSAYYVWTGKTWSTDTGTAQAFKTLDDADEYIRSHFNQVTGQR
jgi:hypothetical protein